MKKGKRGTKDARLVHSRSTLDIVQRYRLEVMNVDPTRQQFVFTMRGDQFAIEFRSY